VPSPFPSAPASSAHPLVSFYPILRLLFLQTQDVWTLQLLQSATLANKDKLVLEGRKLGNREAVCSARARQRLACCAQSPQADFVIKEQRATASGTSGT
jgi:hypothetical protein